MMFFISLLRSSNDRVRRREPNAIQKRIDLYKGRGVLECVL